MHPTRYLPRSLPPALKGLADLAVDLRWSWNHGADELWERVDPELWSVTGDPWLILESVSRRRLEALATDETFLDVLRTQTAARENYLGETTWFGDTHGPDALECVAYFSMEFGLSEALPIYSGGLGSLAGDHLKTASDLGVPVVGVGLLYQQGYFRQALDRQGEQIEFFPYNSPTMLPVMPLRDPDGEWLRVGVELPGRVLQLRGWQVQVGRAVLYLLDSNDLLNNPGDRGITGELYGGGSEMRLQQEMVLGIGGWRLLQALGIDCEVCHLNEGHAAFAVLERARTVMEQVGCPFETALQATRISNLFTTHTPVEAGFDRFPPSLAERYLHDYADQLGLGLPKLLSLGRAEDGGDDQPFNMAYLAMHASAHVNGVSRLHGQVSRGIFQPLFPRWPRAEVPVEHVTNGVHVPSWDSAAADTIWTDACGKSRWLGELDTIEQDLRVVDDVELWDFRRRSRAALVRSVRERMARESAARGDSSRRVAECTEALDPDTLTLGFARRFAAYKRPNLLLHDPPRLTRILINPEFPVQLVIAGKAHPEDREGKRLIHQWSDYIKRTDVGGRVVFLEDYDMSLAADLVQGVDVWINTPRRPWEASGTSGMKVLVNGGLNLSELDGWWAEAYAPEVGWALGDGHEHDDPAWDAHEADALYDLLERDVVPAFYDRQTGGRPTQWIQRIRESMARLTPAFSTNRMLREYTERYYLSGAAAFRARRADNAKLAADLWAWSDAIDRHWPRLHFGRCDVTEVDEHLQFSVEVYLDDLDPDAVQVQLYADAADDRPAVCLPMERRAALDGTVNAHVFQAAVSAQRPASDYTPRIVPRHSHAVVPMESNRIAWLR
jgi:starch phosphorylase